MTSRRSFILGAAALIAAPAVIRTVGLLMPVRKLVSDEINTSIWLIEWSPDTVAWSRDRELKSDGSIRTDNRGRYWRIVWPYQESHGRLV